MDNKLSTVKLIAKHLNDLNITWTVGASLMLFLRGITSSFNDMDIIIDEKDEAIVYKTLSSLGSIQHSNLNPNYATKYFHELVIDNLNIDVMAGLAIKHNNTTYSLPIDPNVINYNYKLDEITIPLDSLERWMEIYNLIDRPQKAAIIKQHLKQQQTAHNNL